MQNPYLALLRTAWQYAQQDKRQYVLIYVLFILANIVTAMHPLLFGWFIESIQRKGTVALDTAGWFAGGFVGLKVLEWAFHGPARVMERRLAFILSRNYLNELYHQTLHLPVSWHKDHHSGSTINRINKAYNALKSFFQNGFVYLHALSKFVFSFGAMLYFSPTFGLIGIALGVLTVYVILRFDRPFVKALEETNEHEHIASSTLFDSLSNISTVIALRLEKRIEARFGETITAIFPPFMRQVRINEWKWFVASMLVALIYVIIATGYVYQHSLPGTVFYIGGLVTLLGYVNQFTSVFNDIALQYTQIVQFNTDVQTVRSIGQAYTGYEQPDSSTALPDTWQTITLSNLNFSYNLTDTDQPFKAILRNVNITLSRGKRVAFIGESGSGKSTLLTLLRGLYTPEPGFSMQVDGQPGSSLNALANTVLLFPQEPEIFENTVGYNITLGLPFTNDEVMQACRTTHFAELVNHMPDGLDTSIQEKGLNLSGGQRQRLALARGVLAAQTSHVVLLDEPTSSVDPKTEFDIYHKLLHAFGDKAVVSTLHRLHLLPMFDYIYILREGEVADEGSFAQLRQNSTLFQAMWAHQKEAVRDEGIEQKKLQPIH